MPGPASWAPGSCSNGHQASVYVVVKGFGKVWGCLLASLLGVALERE